MVGLYIPSAGVADEDRSLLRLDGPERRAVGPCRSLQATIAKLPRRHVPSEGSSNAASRLRYDEHRDTSVHQVL